MKIAFVITLVCCAIAQSSENSRAEWVIKNEPVPSWVLYPYLEQGKQAPPFEVKQQSWHNRILFQKKCCPYCGRRIPTETTSYFFLIIGFLGQGVFASRFLVQWIASEKAKSSVIPTSFWWLSLGGSVLLLTYAIHIKAWPIILGQIPGFFVYARNLHLLWLNKNVSRETSEIKNGG